MIDYTSEKKILAAICHEHSHTGTYSEAKEALESLIPTELDYVT